MSETTKKHPSQCLVGDVIKFTIISPYDTQTYQGPIKGILDYERARPYNLSNTRSGVVKGAALIQKELLEPKDETYLLIQCQDDTLRAIGYQWFTDELVEIITYVGNYDIRLFNVTAEQAAQALDLLRNQEYLCKIVQSSR